MLGDKWSLLIIRDMLFGKKTYTEFANSPEKIASNILADRLKKLEETGIVSKSKIPGNRKSNKYALTQKGIDLIPVLMEMIVWTDTHIPDHIADFTKEYAASYRSNREGTLEKMREQALSFSDN